MVMLAIRTNTRPNWSNINLNQTLSYQNVPIFLPLSMVHEFCVEFINKDKKIHDIGPKLKMVAKNPRWRPKNHDEGCFSFRILGPKPCIMDIFRMGKMPEVQKWRSKYLIWQLKIQDGVCFDEL